VLSPTPVHSVDQNSAMHNCSLGEGSSIGSWKNIWALTIQTTVIYPTVAAFLGAQVRQRKSYTILLAGKDTAGRFCLIEYGGNVCIAKAAPAPRTSNDRIADGAWPPVLDVPSHGTQTGIAVLGVLPVPGIQDSPAGAPSLEIVMVKMTVFIVGLSMHP